MSILRLYMTPRNGNQLVLDVDADDMVLSGQEYVRPQLAQSITIVKPNSPNWSFQPFASSVPIDLSSFQTEQVRVCWREPVDEAVNPAPIAVPDPADGECVCGITCSGTKIAYAKVQTIQ